MAYRFVLPLPRFVLHPFTSLFLGAVHVYLAVGHLGELFAGNLLWTHLWKGFGALGGAYVFAALAARAMGRDPRRPAGANGRRLQDELRNGQGWPAERGQAAEIPSEP